MWHDNETERDFLNFAGVADTVAEIVIQSRGRPISIGVSGSWGIGTSSMIKLIRASVAGRARKDGDREFVFVEFNAWHYQGYDDARAAPMDVIASKLETEAHARNKGIDKAKALLKRVSSCLDQFGFAVAALERRRRPWRNRRARLETAPRCLEGQRRYGLQFPHPRTPLRPICPSCQLGASHPNEIRRQSEVHEGLRPRRPASLGIGVGRGDRRKGSGHRRKTLGGDRCAWGGHTVIALTVSTRSSKIRTNDRSFTLPYAEVHRFVDRRSLGQRVSPPSRCGASTPCHRSRYPRPKRKATTDVDASSLRRGSSNDDASSMEEARASRTIRTRTNSRHSGANYDRGKPSLFDQRQVTTDRPRNKPMNHQPRTHYFDGKTQNTVASVVTSPALPAQFALGV
jgi:hypothetical protein